MARFSKKDWLEIGLQILGQNGPNALRIDQLCTAAKRTRGSFYHHFSDREAYVIALVDHWRQTRTSAVIEKTNASATTAKQGLHDLMLNVMEVEGDFEIAIRRWAASDELVATTLAQVDQERINYMAGLLQQAHSVPPKTAMDLAIIQYAIFLGILSLGEMVSVDERLSTGRLLSKMTENSFDS